jgi:hypothetical protein
VTNIAHWEWRDEDREICYSVALHYLESDGDFSVNVIDLQEVVDWYYDRKQGVVCEYNTEETKIVENWISGRIRDSESVRSSAEAACRKDWLGMVESRRCEKIKTGISSFFDAL